MHHVHSLKIVHLKVFLNKLQFISVLIYALLLHMAHTKQTARKSTGGGVPRRQLAPRNGEQGSGSEQPPLQNPSEWVDMF